jgi:putative inorganic carbon (HCO3(-)) transporter
MRIPLAKTDHPSLLLRIGAVFYLLMTLLQGKIAALELGAFWTIFFIAWAIARKEARLSFHPLYVPLALLGIATTLSSAFAQTRLHEWGEPMLWFKMLIFPALIVLFREVPPLRETVIGAHAVFASYVSLIGLYQFIFLGRRDLEHRITGTFPHVMTYSGVLLGFSLFFLFLWIHQRKWWQLAVTSLTTLTLLLTFTRSAWIGWIVALGAVLLVTRKRVVMYALPVLVVFVTFLPLPLFGRLISTFDLQQSSNFDRLRMFEAGVEMIKDRPLLGVGPANVKEHYALYRKHDAPRPRPPHLHNNVVQLWAERGVLALFAYLLLNAMLVRECLRSWQGPGRVWGEIGLALAASLFIAGLFEFNFGDTEVFYLLLNLTALVVTGIERAEPRTNEVPSSLVAATT